MRILVLTHKEIAASLRFRGEGAPNNEVVVGDPPVDVPGILRGHNESSRFDVEAVGIREVTTFLVHLDDEFMREPLAIGDDGDPYAVEGGKIAYLPRIDVDSVEPPVIFPRQILKV
jgi:hypothetical protein